MKAAVFAFTLGGCEVARKVAAFLGDETKKFTMEKFGLPDFTPYKPPFAAFVKPHFDSCDYLVFVGSAGLAIRGFAPWVRDKRTDPGILVIDEGANYVISMLSGHIGGANAMARQLAALLGAAPVITTATDVRGRFSVDTWASEHGLCISSMKLAKDFSAAVLQQDLPFICEFPVTGNLPAGLYEGTGGELGLYIGVRKVKPFPHTLRLIPRVLHLGIGCKAGTPAERIAGAVSAIFAQHGLSPEAVQDVSSIDLKQNEAGLLEYCRSRSLPVHFYSAAQLNAVPGEFPASEFVKKVTGTDNVCQRAALVSGGRIIVEKSAMDGVTVAVAQENWEAVF